LAEFQAEHPSFDASIFDALDMETAVERRDLPGGPARQRVLAAIQELRGRLSGRELDVDAAAAKFSARPVVDPRREQP
jgi:argininosuccinate lyase